MNENPGEYQYDQEKENTVENSIEQREQKTELIQILLHHHQSVETIRLADGTILNQGQEILAGMEFKVVARSIPQELYLATPPEERWSLLEKLGNSRVYNVTVEAVSQKEGERWEFTGKAQLDPPSRGTLREERDYSLTLLIQGECSVRGDGGGHIGQDSWLEIVGIAEE